MKAVDKILQLAEERGVKQEFLNSLINGYRGKITEWKKGKSSPTDDELRILADYFGVPVEAIVGEIADGMIKPEEASEMAAVVSDNALSNQYSARNVHSSAIVQGDNHGRVIISNGSERILSDDVVELLRIAETLDVRGRHKLLELAFELEDNDINNTKRGNSNG